MRLLTRELTMVAMTLAMKIRLESPRLLAMSTWLAPGAAGRYLVS